MSAFRCTSSFGLLLLHRHLHLVCFCSLVIHGTRGFPPPLSPPGTRRRSRSFFTVSKWTGSAVRVHKQSPRTPSLQPHPFIDDSSASVNPSAVFPDSDPPYLALITERYSCDSDANTARALRALHAAVATNEVDLVSVRVRIPDNHTAILEHEHRLVRMIQQLLQWSTSSDYGNFRVVVSSDWWEAGIRAGAHGVHVKESHRDCIVPACALYQTLALLDSGSSPQLLIGTSVHTIESAVSAYEQHHVDYLFVGTCFETESHPEKKGDMLEGPAFPAKVAAVLDGRQQEQQQQTPLQLRRRPRVLAIGGLDATNCHDQVQRGQYWEGSCADGIATIRAVMCATDPATQVLRIKNAFEKIQ